MNTNSSVKITVGVTTRNRIFSLQRCLQSLVVLRDEILEVIVVDDASEVPLESELTQHFYSELPLRILRQDTNQGYIVARNRIVELAKTDFVLLLDDDTAILDPVSVRLAITGLQSDSSVAAIAFAQGEADGSPWPSGMQPAPVDYSCYVPTFIGFAHLLRRQIFLELGGYREIFHYYGEEKEYCLRALDAGYYVVYMPHCLIAHVPDPSGRNALKYYRSYTRNDCFSALYTLPWIIALPRIAMKFLLYNKVARKHLGLEDREGRKWLIRELLAAWPVIRPDRKAVKWSTLSCWRSYRKEYREYKFRVEGKSS